VHRVGFIIRKVYMFYTEPACSVCVIKQIWNTCCNC